MRIAFFNHSLRLGSGIDVVITELASRIAKRHHVSVFCFDTNYQKDQYNFEINVIRSRLASSKNRISILAPFLIDKVGTLRSQLERYDIVNTHVFPANYISRNLKNPLKVVTEWSVGNASLWPSSLKQRLYVKYLVYRGDKIAVQRADLVISSSKFISNWVQLNYKVTPTLLYIDGINFELLNRDKSTPDKVLRLYPNTLNKQIVLFVGRVTDHKNIHTLIESFYILRKKLNDVILVIVGDYDNYKPYYLRLVQIVKSKGIEKDVIFTGVVPWEDLPSYYSACSIFATCTLWEGFLRPESFAFGKPIVCFNIGPNSETVIHGKNGSLVNEISAVAFANAMYEILSSDSLRRGLGESGYQWAKKNLDFDVASEKFMNLCEMQLSRRT